MVKSGNRSRMRLAILISGRGSNLQSLIDHFGRSAPESPIDIALVISNRMDAQGLQRAAAAGIKGITIDHAQFRDRTAFENAMNRALREAGADFIALAGFMRILSGEFIATWKDRLVNIHPSLLPAFKGLHTHRRAIEAGVRFHGCTVHFVREEMDSGPILAQAVVPVLPDDDEERLADRVLAAEHRLYPLALRLIGEDRVRVRDEIASIEGAAFADGYWFNPLGS